MKKNQKHNIIRLVKLLNFVVMYALFAFIWIRYYNDVIAYASPRRFGFVFVAVYALIYYFLIRVYEGLKISVAPVGEVIYSQLLALLFSDGIMYVITFFLVGKLLTVIPMLALFAVQMLFAALWALFANWLYYHIYRARKTVAIYRDERDFGQMSELNSGSRKFEIRKVLHVPGAVDETVLRELEGMDTVFVRGLPTNERNEVIKYCVQNDIEMYLWPKIGDVILLGAEHTHLFHVSMMRLNRYAPPFEYVFFKRAFDICASLLGILFLSPFMLITAAAIKLGDGGPVLYKQVRLTKDERKFEILKFRSMRIDAEKDGVARLSTGDKDDRITPVGKIIRAIRFDELPQLFNILKGDMSVVGPRPERPEIAEQYVKEMPEFRLRLQAKAGLTGYAQVYGKYNSTPYDKLQMDLLYIAKSSFLEDIRLILATVKILFMKESTEGVAEGQTTASQSEMGEH